MNVETPKERSQLVAALREAVGVIQMILFKELRRRMAETRPDLDGAALSLLVGAITNEIFGTHNPEKRFAQFRTEHWGEIEQQLLALRDNLADLCPELTDALRIQTLCDHQEGKDSSDILKRAEACGFLLADREIPLPSSFMASVRTVGEKHNLIIPPLPPAQETPTVH
jgi:hypothetical protein